MILDQHKGVLMRLSVERTGRQLKELYAVLTPQYFWVGTEQEFVEGPMAGMLQQAADDKAAATISRMCNDLLQTPFAGMLRTLSLEHSSNGMTAQLIELSLYGNGAA